MGARLVVLFLCAGAGFAQQWEIGGAIGYGWYRGVRINGPGAEAKAGISNRFAAGAVVTEDLFDRVSGEIRYTYQDGDPFLSLNGTRGKIQGQSHEFHYDVLIHLRPREERLRPFAAVGIGAKYYRTTGPEPAPQPAPLEATLVRANDWQLLVSLGAGATYKFDNHLLLRADFRDYLTPFPQKLFVPSNGATDRGLFQQFTVLLGVGYWF